MTVFKIYRHLLNESDDAKLLERVPFEISDYLKNANPQVFEKGKVYAHDIEKEFQTNPVALELYILCATGPVKMGFVRSRYGDYGMQVMANLIERKVLSVLAHDQICSGNVQLNISPETVVAFGLRMSRSYLRPAMAYR